MYDVTFLCVLEKIVYKTRERKKYIEIDITICIKDCQLQGKRFAYKECNNAWMGIQLLCLSYSTFWIFSALVGLHMKISKRHTQAL